MSADALRAAIETALRRRDPAARVAFYQRAGGRWPAGIEARCGDARMTVVAETDDAALRDLARLCGLRVTDDGVTDTAEECERMRAHLAAAEERERQSADDAASVAVERDAAEVQLAEARADLARVTAERDALRAAIRADVRCDECPRLATQTADGSHACDEHAGACGGSCGETEHPYPCPAWRDLAYAEAVRENGGER